jgi:HNH endonuclease/Integrase core domain
LYSARQRFPTSIQRQALVRQKFLCASCGTRISALGDSGKQSHQFGERAEGHHVIPHKLGGPITPENCVVLCRACHTSAHQGGRWSDTSIYADLSESAGKSLPRSPTANAICEGVIGTIRRECVDWVIPLSESHLRRILKSWIAHYNTARQNMALGPGRPTPSHCPTTTAPRRNAELLPSGLGLIRSDSLFG